MKKVYERSGRNLFWSIKNSDEVLNNKPNSKGFRASSLSTYDFADLIESTFQREGAPFLACNDRNAFFTSDDQQKKKKKT